MSSTVVGSSDERRSVTVKPVAGKERSAAGDVTDIEKIRRASNGKDGNFC
jgi:hypothetical protein